MATQSPAVALENKLTDIAAERFVQTFYTTLDSRRNDVIRLFTQQSLCIYEGNAAFGIQTITQLYNMLPPSKHTIESIDVQPIDKHALQHQSHTNKPPGVHVGTLLITVSGMVHYGTDARGTGFYHTFVIDKCDAQKPNVHFIVHATFRSRVTDSRQHGQAGSQKRRM